MGISIFGRRRRWRDRRREAAGLMRPDRFAFQPCGISPGMLVSAELDAADHLRGEYLACAPAMRFIEDTVVRMPELVNQLATAQLRLNDARAAIAKSCALRAPKRSPPLKDMHRRLLARLMRPAASRA